MIKAIRTLLLCVLFLSTLCAGAGQATEAPSRQEQDLIPLERAALPVAQGGASFAPPFAQGKV